MDTIQTAETANVATVITSAELLKHWQGHRSLTRRVIEKFPENEFFNHSIGGMRPFVALVKEFLAMAVPGLKQMAEGSDEIFREDFEQYTTKADFLALWDKTTLEIDRLWAKLSDERFGEKIVAFGQYEGTVLSTIQYFVDNEIHHRGQGYVYLRSLGIEPPYFWER